MSEATIVAEADVNVEVHEATVDEGRAVLDRAAQKWLGMSGDAFLQAWHAGEFGDDPERPEVARVAMLIPFAE